MESKIFSPSWFSFIQEDEEEEDEDAEGSDTMSASEDNLLRSVIPRAARKSVTSDLFHQWLESSGSGRSPTGTGQPSSPRSPTREPHNSMYGTHLNVTSCESPGEHGTELGKWMTWIIVFGAESVL